MDKQGSTQIVLVQPPPGNDFHATQVLAPIQPQPERRKLQLAPTGEAYQVPTKFNLCNWTKEDRKTAVTMTLLLFVTIQNRKVQQNGQVCINISDLYTAELRVERKTPDGETTSFQFARPFTSLEEIKRSMRQANLAHNIVSLIFSEIEIANWGKEQLHSRIFTLLVSVCQQVPLQQAIVDDDHEKLRQQITEFFPQ